MSESITEQMARLDQAVREEIVLRMLREAETAAARYNEACQAAGFGWRNADDDARLLSDIENAGDDDPSPLTCTPEEGLLTFLRAHRDVSPWDERGYVHQGMLDEAYEAMRELGVLRDVDDEVCLCDAILPCPIHDEEV